MELNNLNVIIQNLKECELLLEILRNFRQSFSSLLLINIPLYLYKT